jgi:hypothetical protein
LHHHHKSMLTNTDRSELVMKSIIITFHMSHYLAASHLSKFRTLTRDRIVRISLKTDKRLVCTGVTKLLTRLTTTGNHYLLSLPLPSPYTMHCCYPRPSKLRLGTTTASVCVMFLAVSAQVRALGNVWLQLAV